MRRDMAWACADLVWVVRENGEYDYDEAYENAFFESLFKAYKLGGWPCGWKSGKIIVYVPANK